MKRSLIPIAVMVASSPASAAMLPSFAVPEPSTLTLLVAGMLALGIARKRAAK